MKKISYRLVYNRKKKLNKMGTALIQIEAYLDRQKTYFSTGVLIRPDQWDKKHSRIMNHPQEEELNRFIEERMLEYQWKELQSWKQGKPISLSLLEHSDKVVSHRSTNIFDYGRKWVEQSPRKVSTKKNLLTTLEWIHQFNGNLLFEELSYGTLIDFESFLRSNELHPNTIAKHMKQLRTLVNEAIHQDILPLDAYPFKKYRIRTKESHHTYLLPEEMQQLEELQQKNCPKHLRHSLDAFLFCCYTGLRYSDFTHLMEKNIIRTEGHTWLVFLSVKTSVESRLPLDLLFQGKALRILQRYRHQEKAFFELPPNSLVNKQLISIRKLAKMTKHFSFHSARHTNATLLIYKGVQITTVQKLLGHRSVKTTQGYSEVFTGTIVNDLKKCKF